MIIYPKYPNDIYELEKIQNLLDKIPLYENKLQYLIHLIDQLISKVDRDMINPYLYPKDIGDIITKSFFVDIENKPHYKSAIDVFIDIRKYGVVKNRNISCEICGENRTIDKCHIVPRRLKGADHDKNYLYLCPTHHRLFDRFMLSKDEWCRIDWSDKFEISQKYANLTIYELHCRSWNNCSGYTRLEVPEDITEGFTLYLLDIVSECLPLGVGVYEKNFFSLLEDDSIPLMKIFIKVLIKNKVIFKFKNGKKNILLLQEDPKLLFQRNPNFFYI